jgi:hypothetical protein
MQEYWVTGTFFRGPKIVFEAVSENLISWIEFDRDPEFFSTKVKT